MWWRGGSVGGMTASDVTACLSGGTQRNPSNQNFNPVHGKPGARHDRLAPIRDGDPPGGMIRAMLWACGRGQR